MKGKAAAATIILMAGIAVVWFMSTRLSEDTRASSAENFEDEPTIRIGNVDLLQYDDDGSVLFRALASTIEHFVHTDSVTLTDIDLHIAPAEGARWSLKAPTAIIQGATSQSEMRDNQQIDLIGDVLLMSEADTESILSLVGRDLTYYPHERVLVSQEPVTIRNERATLKASAFEFNLESNNFHLLGSTRHRVDIEYAPDIVQN